MTYKGRIFCLKPTKGGGIKVGAVKRGVESDSSLWTSKVRFFVGEWVFRLLVLTQVELNWWSRQGRDNATTMRRGPTLIAQLVPAFF